jgi:predicted permease
MSDVLAITGPIFLLIAAGYFAFSRRILDPSQSRILGAFVLNFALPALIVRALVGRRPAEIVNARYLLAYGLASLAVYAAVFLIARAARGRSQTESAMQALGATASNSGFIGYPVAALVLGPTAGVALSLNMMFENIVLIPLALALAESGRGKAVGLAANIRATAARLSRNPLILAILLGTTLAALGLSLPGPIARAIDMLANASAAVALFAIGGALVGISARGLAGDVLLVVVGKLVAHPLAVFVALLFAPGLDPALRKAALIFSSVSMIAVFPLFAQTYGQERMAAAALLTATATSFLTISALLYFL